MSIYAARERTGVVLIVASFALYAVLLGVPLLLVGAGAKITVAVGLVIAGEAAFWIGCLIAGKEYMLFFRRKLWPANWRRKAHS